jgi:hypothetical protein
MCGDLFSKDFDFIIGIFIQTENFHTKENIDLKQREV